MTTSLVLCFVLLLISLLVNWWQWRRQNRVTPPSAPPPATELNAATPDNQVYQALLASLPDVLVHYHRDGTYLDVYGAEGLLSDMKGRIGKHVSDVHPPETARQIENNIQHALDKQSLVHDELVYIRNGKEHIVENRLVPTGPDTALAMLRDITALRQAEQALAEALDQSERTRQLLQTIINASPDWISAKDAEYRFILGNEAFLKGVGYTLDEVLGKTRMDLNLPQPQVPGPKDPEAPMNLEGIDTTVLQGQTQHIPVTGFNTSNGGYRVFEAHKYPLRDQRGQIYAVLTFGHDITALKQAETRLRTQEAYYRNLFEYSPAGFAVIDGEERILNANHAFCRMLGYSEAELQQTTIADLTHPADLELHQTLLAQLQHTTETSLTLEKRHRRQDGEYIWTMFTASLTLDEAGERQSLVMLIDISERKQLEVQLQQAQKMEAVGQLAGGVAHNFNNMLTAITGHTSLALRKIDGEHQLYPHLTTIRDVAQRAGHLTRQLLNFSRPEQAEVSLINLDTLLSQSAPMLRELVPESIALTYVQTEHAPPVLVNPHDIEQILINLIINARDAMPNGGEITIGTLSQSLKRSHQAWDLPPGEYVALLVEDTGVGMSDKVKQRIFEPFYTTKDIGEGTGLGLSTCFSLVQKYKGYIQVESEPGWGSQFKVYLPAADEAPLPTSEPTQPQQSPLPSGHEAILYVEDDAMVRRTTSRVLSTQGYNLLCAADGRAALQALKDNPHFKPELLLTDVIMPRMNGPELAQTLLNLYPNLHVIFTSGYIADANDRQTIVDIGASFLAKPFTPDSLTQRLRDVFDAPR